MGFMVSKYISQLEKDGYDSNSIEFKIGRDMLSNTHIGYKKLSNTLIPLYYVKRVKCDCILDSDANALKMMIYQDDHKDQEAYMDLIFIDTQHVSTMIGRTVVSLLGYLTLGNHPLGVVYLYVDDYISYEDRTNAAICIQSAWRGWKTRMLVWNPNTVVGNRLYSLKFQQELVNDKLQCVK